MTSTAFSALKSLGFEKCGWISSTGCLVGNKAAEDVTVYPLAQLLRPNRRNVGTLRQDALGSAKDLQASLAIASLWIPKKKRLDCRQALPNRFTSELPVIAVTRATCKLSWCYDHATDAAHFRYTARPL